MSQYDDGVGRARTVEGVACCCWVVPRSMHSMTRYILSCDLVGCAPPSSGQPCWLARQVTSLYSLPMQPPCPPHPHNTMTLHSGPRPTHPKGTPTKSSAPHSCAGNSAFVPPSTWQQHLWCAEAPLPTLHSNQHAYLAFVPQTVLPASHHSTPPSNTLFGRTQ